MKPGQRLTLWWQKYVLGRLNTPQAIMAAARAENPDAYEDRFTKDPLDRDVWDIPARLAAPAFCRSEVYTRQQMRADWQFADHRLREWAARVVVGLRKMDIPVYVHCCCRTQAEQEALRRKGTSKVGWPRSAHNIGEAVDIVHGVYHWNLTPKEWQFIYFYASDVLRKMNSKLPKEKRLHLNWGGPEPHKTKDSFGWDPAHWEIEDYRERTREIRAGVPVLLSPSAILKR